MASNPANFQNIKPSTNSFTMERVGITRANMGPVINWDLTGVQFNPATEFHLWVAPQEVALAIPVNITVYTPIMPILWSASGGSPYGNNVYLQLIKDDLDALAQFAGNFNYELLCSIDGGTTIEKVCKGLITVPSFLTYNW